MFPFILITVAGILHALAIGLADKRKETGLTPYVVATFAVAVFAMGMRLLCGP